MNQIKMDFLQLQTGAMEEESGSRQAVEAPD